MFEQTKALCSQFLKMGIPGFDLIVYQNGQCVLRHMGGYADPENKIPVQGKEKYHIYSCSKLFTCAAAMQLWEKGMFSLEDKLSDYLPAFAEMTVKTKNGIEKAKNPIRIHHLFEMTAGFSYDLNSPSMMKLRQDSQGKCCTRDLARALAREPLLFEPGERYFYSLAHDVLGALIEVLSGQEFSAYVKEHIFAPLGMTHSDLMLPLEEFEQVIPLYLGTEEGRKIILHPDGKVPRSRVGDKVASGGGGGVSTVEDYIKFAEALRTGEKLLKRETIQMMTTQRLNPQQLDTFTYKTHGYGLGMRVPRGDGLRSDFGWGGAAGAYLAVDIPNGISLFYAQHVRTAPNQPLRARIYETVVEELTGVPLKQPAQPQIVDRNLTY
jgi:CubicO group peptidase (beta-lactamase class C family)